MNRLRQYNDKYQVLITPYHRFDSDASLMLGGWNDPDLKGYKILTFDTMEEAMGEAFNHPDILWNRLIEFHKDIYVELYMRIKNKITANGIVCEYDPYLLTGEQLKNIMFDRVMNYGERFRLTYNMNDIICFHITNPWTKNLKIIMKILQNDSRLRITKYTYESGIYRLVGETSLGTSYEIVLWTTVLGNWGKWCYLHPNIPKEQIEKNLQNALMTQSEIDNRQYIR